MWEHWVLLVGLLLSVGRFIIFASGNGQIFYQHLVYVHYLCKLQDKIIRPFVEKSFSYIKDSQNFIQKNINKKYPKNAKIFTFDVVSLYTNIDHDKCLETLSDFFKDKLDPDFGIDIFGFREILRLVLKNNFYSTIRELLYLVKNTLKAQIRSLKTAACVLINQICIRFKN